MEKNTKVWLGRGIFLLILIFIALYILVWTGNIRCRSVTGMCSVYWGIQTVVTGKQQPSILIVFDPNDSEGLGNPYLLDRLLSDKTSVGMHPTTQNINYLSPDMLTNTSLVIVEHATKISTQKLETFMNYVSKGGRLIWIGNAGTKGESPADKLLTKGDEEGSTDKNIIGGWARLNNYDYMIRFDEFLGARYETTYCDLKECLEKNYKINPGISNETITIKYPDHVNGTLIPSSNHPLVYALREYLQVSDNFAIVQETIPNNTPLKLDYGSNLYSDAKTSVGQVFPLIIVSNANKVAYYAIPPEYLCEDDDKEKYLSIIENMIYGMLK